jgi:hypothetical protein
MEKALKKFLVVRAAEQQLLLKNTTSTSLQGM